jgi:hypothetical protein
LGLSAGLPELEAARTDLSPEKSGVSRFALPKKIDGWSLTSLQQRLVKTGGRLVKLARYYWWMLLVESHLTQRLFGSMLRRIKALPVPAG